MLAMEMKPEDRFQNVEDFNIALKQLSVYQNLQTKPKVDFKSDKYLTDYSPKKSKFNFLIAIASVLIVLMAIFGVNAMVQNISQGEQKKLEKIDLKGENLKDKNKFYKIPTNPEQPFGQEAKEDVNTEVFKNEEELIFEGEVEDNDEEEEEEEEDEDEDEDEDDYEDEDDIENDK
jgi:hypothetical protein